MTAQTRLGTEQLREQNTATASCLSNRVLLLENIQGYEILSAEILPF